MVKNIVLFQSNRLLFSTSGTKLLIVFAKGLCKHITEQDFAKRMIKIQEKTVLEYVYVLLNLYSLVQSPKLLLTSKLKEFFVKAGFAWQT